MFKLRLFSPALIVLSLLSLGSLSAKAASDKEWDEVALTSASRDTVPYLGFSGEGILYGLSLTSSAATGAFVLLRDTDTANIVSNSFATVFFSSQSVSAGGFAIAGSVWVPPFPIRITNGLSINASNCPPYGAGQSCVTAYYRKVFR